MRVDWVEVELEKLLVLSKEKYKPTDTQTLFYIGLEHIEKGSGKLLDYVAEEDITTVKNSFEKGDILYGKLRPYLNKVHLAQKDGVCSTDILVLKPSKYIDSVFYLNFMLSRSFVNDMSANTSGVNLPRVSTKYVQNYKAPLPPLPEQRAIVAKIEQLFSDLDNGIVNLKAAQDKLDIYRQAVLKQAFEGELTREWREKQPIIPSTELGYIADVGTGATPKKSEASYWTDGNIAWVTSGALNDLFVNEPSGLITAKAVKETNCKVFPIGTLLIAMYGEGKTRGKCSELKIPASTNQAIAAINLRPDFLASKNYVKWFLVKNYNDIRMVSSGGVQPNLNLAKVKSISLPFPSVEEQNQIVQEIEARLSVCDKLADTIQTSLQQAEALRQSILKKAFEGRLLTETELQACQAEADWMPAEQLLAQIKNQAK